MIKKIIQFVFIILVPFNLMSQKIGDNSFKIQMEEKNKFIGKGVSLSSDFVLTFEVDYNAHYIYYYMTNDICESISEKIVSSDAKSTYELYKNILDSNDFGIKVSQTEGPEYYTCFIKDGIKLRVSIKKSFTKKNSWEIFIDSGKNVKKTPKYGC